MTYLVRVMTDAWVLKAPDGTELSSGTLPVTTPDDIAEPVDNHAGSLVPIYQGQYEIVDER